VIICVAAHADSGTKRVDEETTGINERRRLTGKMKEKSLKKVGVAKGAKQSEIARKRLRVTTLKIRYHN
jgi:hypothetical protein